MWYRFATQSEINIPLPDYIRQIMTEIANVGGRALIVGGAVRDAYLGKKSKDVDFEVYRVNYETLSNILKRYGRTDLVGESFGIIKFVGPDKQDFDFSLPRLDNKTGVGHKDFDVTVSSDLSPEQAAMRRDFTINAVSYDPLTGEIIDPFGGRKDLKNKVLRHTSDAFAEDPVRVLRGMQFIARFPGFKVAPETIQLMKQMPEDYRNNRPKMMLDYQNGGREEMIKQYEAKRLAKIQNWLNKNPGATREQAEKNIPDEALKRYPVNPEDMFPKTLYDAMSKERVEGEFNKLITKGKRPGDALEYLYSTGWSENFPEIHNLRGVPQEFDYHPEGWSVRVVSPDSLRAGMAVAKPINLLTRQLLLSSSTNSTSNEPGNITASTKLFVKPGVFNSDLFSTYRARPGNFTLSPAIYSPTSVTPTKSLVRDIRTSAENTNKAIGIVFQIPVSSVLAIMGSAVNDNEIIQGIIKSVAIYVMNMLGGKKLSAQVKLHNVSMQKHAAGTLSGDGNFSISPGIIDPKFSIVDNNVIFYFYLSGVGDVNTHINNIGDDSQHILVTPGDVATHTSHVMNEAARIADEKGLSPEEREVLVYAAMCHDFAKPQTTRVMDKKGVPRISSHGHEQQGGPMARNFLQSIGVSKKIIDQVAPLVENHLNHIHHSNTNKKESFVKQLAERLHPSNIKSLENLIEADHSGRPPLPKMLPEEARLMSEMARQQNVYDKKADNLLTGKDIIAYTNGQPSPIIGKVLGESRAMILNHHPEMQDRQSALNWLHRRMQKENKLINGNDVINALGVNGPQVKTILDSALQAQKNGQFSDRAGALEWLKRQNVV